MTRINTIDPRFLCDKHLAAEYRELPRVLNLAVKRMESLVAQHDLPVLLARDMLKDNYPNVPGTYRLGTGHVTFFADKLGWVYRRHLQLIAELQYRAMLRGGEPFRANIDLGPTFRRLYTYVPHWCNDWAPSVEDHVLLIQRLISNMADAKTVPMINGRALFTHDEVWLWVHGICNFYGLSHYSRAVLQLTIRDHFPA